MWWLKNILLISGFLVYCNHANAKLYGFENLNNQTHSSQIVFDAPPEQLINYRANMRDNINMLVTYAKNKNPNFQIILHEPVELLEKSWKEYDLDMYNTIRMNASLTEDPTFLQNKSEKKVPYTPEEKKEMKKFLSKIDGVALNNLFCSQKKPQNVKLPLLSIDKCSGQEAVLEAWQEANGSFVPTYAFISNEYGFGKNNAPINNENSNNIFKIKDAKNFRILIDESKYADKYALLEDMQKNNYDILVINPKFDNNYWTSKEINSLKFKQNGAKRLVIAMVNISEADKTDFYWLKNWKHGTPQWLHGPSDVDTNKTVTVYWHDDWKQIISQYFRDVQNVGYDGAFITGIENFLYFENITPLE